ncbi:very short patch repair endonuclease [Lutimonas vermicola]|uniref:Very short patch repair endonuclease n=1 Tax=Lutimonas vermicola TaxID=414288 RepID=A0ABU9KXD3_9FLAO
MTDVHSKETRSFNMSRIKGKNTKPEILVRRHLFSKGFRFRLHDKNLPGKPDIVLKKYKTVIFVNGCFWHGHKNCKYAVIPKTRTEWWKDKINKTISRDSYNHSTVIKDGWNVVIIWECHLKPDRITKTLEDLVLELHSL